MKFRITIALTCFVCFTALGQDNLPCNQNRFDDSLLEKLAGKWNLTGTIGKKDVKNDFSASWILNHQFIELNFTDVTPGGYAAKVLIGYDCVSERYVIHWLDSMGSRLSETLGYGKKTGDTIELHFEYPDGPFINRITYNPVKNTWQFYMTSKDSSGKWKIFGEEFLSRK